MVPELITAGSSILGGILQGQAAKKAAKIQAGAQQSARQAQEKAYSEVKQQQAPYIQAGYTGLNALTQRLGLPGEAVSGAIAAAGPKGPFDAQAYLNERPDVLAEFNRLSPDNIRNNLGIDYTPEAFAQWHHNQYGQYGPSPSQPQVHPAQASTPEASQFPVGSGAALTGNPGTYGGAADGAYHAPDPYQTSAFDYDLDAYEASPAYQWQQNEARRGIQAAAAAGGYLQSGAAAKALQDRAQQIAYQDFFNERAFARNSFEDDRDFDFSRYVDQRNFDRNRYADDRNYLTGRYDAGVDDLMGYTDMGRQSGLVTSNAALGTGSAIGETYVGAGNAQAGAALSQGNIWSGVVNDVGKTLAQPISDQLAKMFPTQTPYRSQTQPVPLPAPGRRTI